jgi:CRISPR/Cas system-associated endonuclease/helicase Cas3
VGLDECEKYLDANIKKFDLVLSSKKHEKRFKEILYTIDKCSIENGFKRIVKMYVESRCNRLKQKYSKLIIIYDEMLGS